MSNTSQLVNTISHLNTLQEIRNNVKLNILSLEINKKGDILSKAKDLNINPAALNRAISEERIVKIVPSIQSSKAAILSWLKTDKEVLIFSKRYDLNNISARKLISLVKIWNSELQEDPLKLLTQQQNDLIIGSTLGDANIRQRDRNCNFRVSHSLNQKEYLMFKYNLLKEFTNLGPALTERTKKNSRKLITFDMSTFTHYAFNYYRKLFYKNGVKVVNRELLDLLNPRSLAYWICDDGSYSTTQDYIILCTNSFTLEEHKIMKKYFNEVWNLDPTIGFKDNKYYYLRFKKEDTKKLVNIIKSFVPESMKHKIGDKNG